MSRVSATASMEMTAAALSAKVEFGPAPSSIAPVLFADYSRWERKPRRPCTPRSTPKLPTSHGLPRQHRQPQPRKHCCVQGYSPAKSDRATKTSGGAAHQVSPARPPRTGAGGARSSPLRKKTAASREKESFTQSLRLLKVRHRVCVCRTMSLNSTVS